MAIFTHFICMWTWSGRCKIIGTGCHVIGTGCVLGRAPCTKETLLDFHKWCQVTRCPRVFRGLMGGQRDTPVLGRHIYALSTLSFTKHYQNSSSQINQICSSHENLYIFGYITKRIK